MFAPTSKSSSRKTTAKPDESPSMALAALITKATRSSGMATLYVGVHLSLKRRAGWTKRRCDARCTSTEPFPPTCKAMPRAEAVAPRTCAADTPTARNDTQPTSSAVPGGGSAMPMTRCVAASAASGTGAARCRDSNVVAVRDASALEVVVRGAVVVIVNEDVSGATCSEFLFLLVVDAAAVAWRRADFPSTSESTSSNPCSNCTDAVLFASVADELFAKPSPSETRS
mmetsp:Transcript_71863/g.199426  ORF Transcript_71863/g.199426 Transcript_71863/m.199426 type:complete len:228 (-) Transcript_71863:659-1342(-)